MQLGSPKPSGMTYPRLLILLLSFAAHTNGLPVDPRTNTTDILTTRGEAKSDGKGLSDEAIIGIAKRLAFPGYLDQQRLATLLARTGLDDRAPVTDLLAALRADLAGFSDHFQAEFREFRDNRCSTCASLAANAWLASVNSASCPAISVI